MSRFTGSSNQAASTASNVIILTFAYLDYSSGIVRAHNGVGTINWDGNDWLGVGQYGNISSIAEGSDLTAKAIRATLSGVDAGLLSDVIDDDYYGRAARFYTGFFDTEYQLLEDPELEWSGTMDSCNIQIGSGTGTITVTCENDLVRAGRPNLIRFTNEDQISRHPSDLIFSQIPYIQDKILKWGGKRVPVGGGLDPGGGDRSKNEGQSRRQK